METVKQPSPSTYPEIYAERNSRLYRGPASDLTFRFSSAERTKYVRSHVLKGRSVVTGSGTKCADFPRDYPLAVTTSLASHTRRASPLLAGYLPKSLSARAIQLPDKEFRSDCYFYDLSDTDRRVDVCLPPYVAIGPGPYLRLSRAGWRVASEGSWRMKRQWTSLLIVRTRCIVTRTRVARDPRIFQHIASCTVGIASAGGNERPLLARKGHVTLGPL